MLTKEIPYGRLSVAQTKNHLISIAARSKHEVYGQTLRQVKEELFPFSFSVIKDKTCGTMIQMFRSILTRRKSDEVKLKHHPHDVFLHFCNELLFYQA